MTRLFALSRLVSPVPDLERQLSRSIATEQTTLPFNDLNTGVLYREDNLIQLSKFPAESVDLKPFEFQNWIINAVHGAQAARSTHDMGIDGYWFLTKEPIQVKQSPTVGRNVVDNFETALRRANHTRGYIIGFSFTRDAREEVARVKKEGLDIELVKVAEVLLQVKRPGGLPKKLGPQPESVEELPLPPMRKSDELPSAEELIKSDRTG